MRNSWIVAGFLALVAPLVNAGDSSALKSLTTRDDSRGWEAVGRLNFANQSFCTGALIAEDLVLTAAHCLFDQDSGRRFNPGEIEFLAGWRNGRASARSGVSKAIAHPEFEFRSPTGEVRVANDLALLQLARPIRKTSVVPFETESRPRKGAEVGVVSYGRSRSESPSLQEVCHVLARRSGTLILSCEADYGSSGAPVFSFDDNGAARIVSVISARAEISGRQVTLASSLEKPLADLMALLANTETAVPVVGAGVTVLKLGKSSGSGAKFVRP